MTGCADTNDVIQLTQSALEDHDRRLAGIPPVMCGQFVTEARLLETALIGIYRLVVMQAKKEDDVDEIGKWWNVMVNVCDSVASKLGELSSAHPGCGADLYYDRVLDLRNKCQRLATMHLA